MDHPGPATRRLLEAKQRFVQERGGPRRAAWYGRLYRLAVWERAVFYGLAGRLSRQGGWPERAQRARRRWQAVKNGPGDQGPDRGRA